MSSPSAPAPTTAFIRLCRTDEIAPGLGRAFAIAGRSVAVFHTRAGSFHASDNACPHAGGPLADGVIAGDCVVCPFHAYRFELGSGKCAGGGGSAPNLATYPVSVHDGWIFLELPPAPPAAAGPA